MADYPNQFDDLERDLREGLAARPAPDGFAERALARVADKEATHEQRPFRALLYNDVLAREARPVLFRHWRAALAAVLIATVLLAAGFWQRRQRRIAGERARAQVYLALRITNSTLDAILQQKLQRTDKEAQP